MHRVGHCSGLAHSLLTNAQGWKREAQVWGETSPLQDTTCARSCGFECCQDTISLNWKVIAQDYEFVTIWPSVGPSVVTLLSLAEVHSVAPKKQQSDCPKANLTFEVMMKSILRKVTTTLFMWSWEKFGHHEIRWASQANIAQFWLNWRITLTEVRRWFRAKAAVRPLVECAIKVEQSGWTMCGYFAWLFESDQSELMWCTSYCVINGSSSIEIPQQVMRAQSPRCVKLGTH